MLLDPRNGPEWDLPMPSAPRRVWVVASIPRTGSTLLCNAIWDTGRAGAPKEYLNPMQLRDWELRFGTAASRWRHRPVDGPLLAAVGRVGWSDDRVDAHLERVARRRTGPTGWFGLKLHWHHHQRWFLARGRHPDDALGPIRWVYVTRRDRVAQAVSWAKAQQTNRWASFQRGGLPPIYSRRRIAARLRDIEAAERGWEQYFAERGIVPLRLAYEEFADDLGAGVRAVLRWLDDPEADRIVAPEPSLERQRDAVNEAWIARWRDGG